MTQPIDNNSSRGKGDNAAIDKSLVDYYEEVAMVVVIY